MTAYYIKSLHIEKLWGYRNINLSFNKDVNIIIGPNASGKTTILNLLRFILSPDFIQLRDIEFEKVKIGFKSFDNNHTRTIVVVSKDTGYKYTVSKNVYEIPMDPMLREVNNLPARFRARARLRSRNIELELSLNEIAKTVWLPVSRRLPVSEEDEVRDTRQNLESVDVRLRELWEALKSYRLGLEAKLSLQYKGFERKVLSEILYSKEYDHVGSLSLRATKPEDKQQLIRAFEVAGLLDSTMKERIDEHFLAADDAMRTFTSHSKKGQLEMDNVEVLDVLFILPLLRRTKSIVDYARNLEEDRKKLFSPLVKFENIVNDFLQPKIIKIDESGALSIHSPNQPDIVPHMLSSGEKQILILLIQALVREDEPIIYVADEPELSLHVKWQENLLSSLILLTKKIQIIVATHSPDIVGPFTDKIIDLGQIE